MELEIINVHNSGDANSEYVELIINEDINLGNFMILDNSYDSNGLSNTHRHPYIFPNIESKKGQKINLYTGVGDDVIDGRINLYWNSDHAIWNDREDTAFLIKIIDIQVYTIKKSPKLRLTEIMKKGQNKRSLLLQDLYKKLDKGTFFDDE